MASKKSPDKKSQPDVDSTPAAPEPAPEPEAETIQAPAASEVATAPTHRTRGMIAAAAAVLLLAGGLVGFGIGRSTAGDDSPGFNKIGQFRPGQGPGMQRDGSRGDRRQRGSGTGSDQDNAPRGQSNDVPSAPSSDDANTSGA